MVPRCPRVLTLGTDMSGMDVPAMALRNLGIKFRHVFSCDNDGDCRKFIENVHQPELVYDDIVGRDESAVPSSHIYAFAHPCQHLSGLGIATKLPGDPKESLWRPVFNHIRTHLPRAILMENVANLLNNKKLFSKLKRSFIKLGYTIYFRILNTAQHGVPQHRRRLYLVGLLYERRPFVWPEDIPLITTTEWLDKYNAATDRKGRLPKNLRHKRIVKHVFNKWYTTKGIDPRRSRLFVDIGSSFKFAYCKLGELTTLTKNRGGDRCIWISTRGRRVSLEELFRFQGISPASIDWKKVVSKKSMGRMLGNAMSLNVCERVMRNLVWSAGLVNSEPVDRWLNNTVEFA